MSGSEILSSINKTSGSGIDIASLVENLVAVETQVSQSNITKDKESIETKISELGRLSSQLSKLKGDMDSYTSATPFSIENSHVNNFQVIVSNPQAIEESDEEEDQDDEDDFEEENEDEYEDDDEDESDYED